MRAVIQRVASAAVTVDGEEIASIGRGMLVLLGVTHEDDEAAVTTMADKLSQLRIFDDEAGKMNLSVGNCSSFLSSPCTETFAKDGGQVLPRQPDPNMHAACTSKLSKR